MAVISSVAPFFGAVAAVLAGQDAPTLSLAIAAALMGLGAWLSVSEHRAHEHRHEFMEQEHSHTHDEHRVHDHAFAWDGVEPQFIRTCTPQSPTATRIVATSIIGIRISHRRAVRRGTQGNRAHAVLASRSATDARSPTRIARPPTPNPLTAAVNAV